MSHPSPAVGRGSGQGSKTRALLIVATTLYLVVVGLITLTPSSSTGHGVMWHVACLVHRVTGVDWVTEPGLELTANIMMFVPLGLLGVPLVGRARWWWVVLAGAALTCFVELVQHWIPGRVPDVRDLAANTSGALLGALVVLLVVRLRQARAG